MSRLIKYIVNEKYSEINKQLDKILSECKPMVEMVRKSGYNYVYRSSKSEYPLGKRKISGERKPRYIDKELHEILGGWSKEKFGWNMREDGLFCGSLDLFPHTYNYIIFPIGTFKYAVHPDIDNLWSFFNKGLWSGYKEPRDEEEKDYYEKMEKDMKVEFDKYRDKGLHNIMKSDKDWEVIIKCKEYYPIDISYEDIITERLND